MDLGLTAKRAIVTGGSRGIGYAIARALATEGADVVIAARTAADLDIAAKTLSEETGRRIVPVPTDTSDQASVDALVARAVAELGGVDILVNSAATPWTADKPTSFAATTDDIVRNEVEIKVLGCLRTARAVAPYLIEQGWGRIRFWLTLRDGATPCLSAGSRRFCLTDFDHGSQPRYRKQRSIRALQHQR